MKAVSAPLEQSVVAPTGLAIAMPAGSVSVKAMLLTRPAPLVREYVSSVVLPGPMVEGAKALLNVGGATWADGPAWVGPGKIIANNSPDNKTRPTLIPVSTAVDKKERLRINE